MSGLSILRKTWIRRNKIIMAQRKYTKHPFSAPQNTWWVMKANTLKLTEIFFKSSAMYNYPFKHCILRTSAITLSEIRTIILNAAWHTPTTSSISKGFTKDSPNSRMYCFQRLFLIFSEPVNTRTGLRCSKFLMWGKLKWVQSHK